MKGKKQSLGVGILKIVEAKKTPKQESTWNSWKNEEKIYSGILPWYILLFLINAIRELIFCLFSLILCLNSNEKVTMTWKNFAYILYKINYEIINFEARAELLKRAPEHYSYNDIKSSSLYLKTLSLLKTKQPMIFCAKLVKKNTEERFSLIKSSWENEKETIDELQAKRAI